MKGLGWDSHMWPHRHTLTLMIVTFGSCHHSSQFPNIVVTMTIFSGLAKSETLPHAPLFSGIDTQTTMTGGSPRSHSRGIRPQESCNTLYSNSAMSIKKTTILNFLKLLTDPTPLNHILCTKCCSKHIRYIVYLILTTTL